jgi:ABC-type multidrug transport system fused ATPase/permease subunit
MFKGFRYLREMVAFGWPFLRTYWLRFFTGVLLGVAYAAVNGLSVGIAPLIVDRLQHESPKIAVVDSTSKLIPEKSGGPIREEIDKLLAPLLGVTSSIKKSLQEGGEVTRNYLDQWLPRKGRPVTSQEIFGAIFLISFLTTSRGLLNYMSVYCMSWANERMIQDMRCAVVAKLNSLSLSFFNRSSTAELTQRIDQDTGSLQRAFVLGMPDLVKEPFTLLFVCLWLVYIDWRLALFAFVFLPACVVPAIILGKKLKRVSIQQRETGVNQGNLILQVLANIRVVKAFGLEKVQGDNYRLLSNELVRHNVNANKKKTMVNPIIESVSGIAMGALLAYIFYAGYDLGEIAGFMLALGLCFAPVKKLANLNMLFQQTSVGVNRLIELFAEKPAVQELKNSTVLNSFKNQIEFKSVSFAYGTSPVIKDLDLIIPFGSKVGIVGESGSGKSTLVNLLFRFYDVSQGQIKIDGHDLRNLKLLSLRQHMALVSQEVLLFNRSVAENIGYGKAVATRTEIEAAAKAAYADHFITELPKGYDTLVGECGNRLSGGQRQRVALARAFVRKAPILVLDEATAALDSDSEKEIQDAIDALSGDQTIISVAHRLATLRTMDFIIVLEKGRLVEKGSFRELLDQNGIFKRLASHQGIA